MFLGIRIVSRMQVTIRKGIEMSSAEKPPSHVLLTFMSNFVNMAKPKNSIKNLIFLVCVEILDPFVERTY